MSEAGLNILCFSVEPEARPELLVRADELSADQEASCSLAVLGADPDDKLERYGSFGAEVVHVVNSERLADYNPETYAKALASVIQAMQPNLVLVAGSQLGLELAATISQALQAGCVTDLIAIKKEGSTIQVKGSIYSGRAEATYLVNTPPVIGTIVPKMGPMEPIGESEAAVQRHEVEISDPSLALIEVRAKEVFDRGLARAEIVVDFGQGIKSAEDIEMIEKLAELLGAKIACTRPISSEREWMPDFIGLSGKRISPRLCLAVGVAGAVQHMVGLRDAEMIAAINSDPEAAIFSQSDYGIVGDLYQVIPAMIDELKARGYPR